MKTLREYLRHADECDALAKTAIAEEQRVLIARMAETWRMLAKQREKHLLAKATVEAIDAGVRIDRPKPALEEPRGQKDSSG
jgi:hypothetical protein